jgi:uncharacterized protein (TIGR03118 family)
VKTSHQRLLFLICSLVSTVAIVVTTTAMTAAQEQARSASSEPLASSHAYTVHNLVSDGAIPADHIDPDLVNPWGIALGANSPMWVADNETGVSTLYDGAGVTQSLVVTIPPPMGGMPPSHPTGIVSSRGSDFVVSNGTIAGWAPNVDATHAIIAVDNSALGAIYKGLAIGGNGTAHFLCATDFHHNRVDVFDSAFHPVASPGGFSDPRIPDKFAPFGIQNILGNICVTYAKQDDEGEDDVTGPGLGFVDVFDTDGTLLRRFATRGRLNAPWGLALAPADFGKFSNTLLVANFGDGRISAYDLRTRELRGQLRGADRSFIAIEGLWGIAFGNGVALQPTNALFFAAGPDDEEHGRYGRIDPEPAR